MTLQQALHDDHQRLNVLFDELLNRAHGGDPATLQAGWAEFERGIAAHLEIEEHSMLPLFDRTNPAEAAVIRAEHRQIRSLLAELGVAAEIHLVREDMVEELVRFLRAHAAREESSLYGWADRELSTETRGSILHRLGHVFRSDDGKDPAPTVH